MTKEVKEDCFDMAVDCLVSYADAIGYKVEEPEECVRWELAKAFYKEFKKEQEEQEYALFNRKP